MEDSISHKRGQYSGYLEVQGGNLGKKWTRMWVTVGNGWLNFYKDDTQTETISTVPLTGLEIKMVSKKDTKKFDFGLMLSCPPKKMKEFFCCMESPEDLQLWFSYIKDAIVFSSPEIFGIELELVIIKGNIGGFVPQIVTKSLEALQPHVDAEGLFRLSGSVDDVNRLKASFNSGSPIDFTGVSNPHTISNLLKLFFRELPDPLLTYSRYEKFLSVAKESNEHKLSKLKAVIEELPKCNRETLSCLLNFLKVVSERSSVNKMTALNLATVFGPTILRPREESLETAMNNDLINPLTETMIQNVEFLFGNHVKITSSALPETTVEKQMSLPPRPPPFDYELESSSSSSSSVSSSSNVTSSTVIPVTIIPRKKVVTIPILPGGGMDELNNRIKSRTQNNPNQPTQAKGLVRSPSDSVQPAQQQQQQQQQSIAATSSSSLTSSAPSAPVSVPPTLTTPPMLITPPPMLTTPPPTLNTPPLPPPALSVPPPLTNAPRSTNPPVGNSQSFLYSPSSMRPQPTMPVSASFFSPQPISSSASIARVSSAPTVSHPQHHHQQQQQQQPEQQQQQQRSPTRSPSPTAYQEGISSSSISTTSAPQPSYLSPESLSQAKYFSRKSGELSATSASVAGGYNVNLQLLEERMKALEETQAKQTEMLKIIMTRLGL